MMKLTKQRWENALLLLLIYGSFYKIMLYPIIYPIIDKYFNIQLLPLSDMELFLDLLGLSGIAGMNLYEIKSKIKNGKKIGDKDNAAKER